MTVFLFAILTAILRVCPGSGIGAARARVVPTARQAGDVPPFARFHGLRIPAQGDVSGDFRKSLAAVATLQERYRIDE